MTDRLKTILIEHLFSDRIKVSRFKYERDHLWIEYFDSGGNKFVRRFNTEGRFTELNLDEYGA